MLIPFFTKIGNRIQRIDSGIAEEVMVRLYEESIIVLPVHDSFIVRRGFEGYMKRTMREVFEEMIQVEPGMKINLREGEDSNPETATKEVLSGDDMTKIIKETFGKYINYETRQYQWNNSGA